MLRKIKKYSIVLILVIQPLMVFSATQPPAGQYQGSDMERQLNAFGGDKGANLGVPQDPRIIVARIIKISLSVIGTIAVILAVYAGFLIMTSSGNEEKMAEGKKIIMYCTVGVAIILGSYSIVFFIYTGIYNSWINPMTIGNQGSVYLQNDPTLYKTTDPLEGAGSVPAYPLGQ